MQTAYNSCLNETALKEAGMQPLHSLITEVARLFPVEENAGADEFGKADYESLSNTIVFLEKLGITTFEYLFTGADEKNPVRQPVTMGLQESRKLTFLGRCHCSGFPCWDFLAVRGVLRESGKYVEIPVCDGKCVRQPASHQYVPSCSDNFGAVSCRPREEDCGYDTASRGHARCDCKCHTISRSRFRLKPCVRNFIIWSTCQRPPRSAQRWVLTESCRLWYLQITLSIRCSWLFLNSQGTFRIC